MNFKDFKDCYHSDMNFKDCYHSDVCGFECDEAITFCANFKDKSRIIELPCKVGDKAYYLSIKRAVPLTYKIEQAEVLNYNINRYGIFDVKIRQLNSDYIFRTSIDKIYFTKEEAEAKLKELEK